MKLKEQVCSQDLAKRLKELGAKQESSFYWFNNTLIWRSLAPNTRNLFIDAYGWAINIYMESDSVYSAFTVAELGKLLPSHFQSVKGVQTFTVCHNPHDPLSNEGARCESSDTEADARAKMLIYLLENQLLNL